LADDHSPVLHSFSEGGSSFAALLLAVAVAFLDDTRIATAYLFTFYFLLLALSAMPVRHSFWRKLLAIQLFTFYFLLFTWFYYQPLAMSY